MDIGKGAASDAKYLVEPKIGSPDIAGDLQPAIITNQSGARSLTAEDIEYITSIETKEDKIEATRNFYGGAGNWYLNTFRPNFMNEGKPYPTTNVKMPTLTEGTVDNKPLFTYYAMAKNDPNIPGSLRDHITDNDYFYWVASRCVLSDDNSASFVVRYVGRTLVFSEFYCMLTGDADELFGGTVGNLVRPVVVLDSTAQLNSSSKEGYDWEVDQN